MKSKMQLDGHKLLHHLDRLTAWQRQGDCFPIYVSFGPVKKCNHKCIFCAYESVEKHKEIFPLNRFESLVDELTTLGVKSLFFSGDGEPLLHPNISEMIQYAKAKGLSLALNTNGTLLNSKIAHEIIPCLDWIRVSINGATDETYSAIHQTSKTHFSELFDNLIFLVNAKNSQTSKCTIGVQSLLLRENISTLPILVERLSRLNIDYFSLKPYLPHPNSSYRPGSFSKQDIEILDKNLKIHETDRFKVHVRAHLENSPARNYNQCHSFCFMTEIDALGEIYTCGPMVGNPDFSLGNILNESFESIWKKKQSMINSIYSTHNPNQCMPGCRNDQINRFLWDLKSPPDHVNFI